jgi:hypothetical protein
MLHGGGLFGKGPWQHEFGFENRAGRLHETVLGGPHPFEDGMPQMSLHAFHRAARLAFVPATVEVLGDGAQLHWQDVGKVFWFDLAAFFPAETNQRGRIIAHDNPSVRATDKSASVRY